MYERLDRSDGRVLGYEVRGRLSEDEFESILRDIEAVVAEHGSVRLLVSVPALPSPDLDALDEDVGFWLEHGDDVERYAVVGDDELLAWATELQDRVTSADVRYFEGDDLDEAWAWLEGSAGDGPVERHGEHGEEAAEQRPAGDDDEAGDEHDRE